MTTTPTEYFKTFIKNIVEISGIYVLWITIHYICANLYPQFCAELSLFGFIKSIFVAESPHCVAMRWVIYHGGNIIHGMWTSIGIWITGKILTSATTAFR